MWIECGSERWRPRVDNPCSFAAESESPEKSGDPPVIIHLVNDMLFTYPSQFCSSSRLPLSELLRPSQYSWISRIPITKFALQIRNSVSLEKDDAIVQKKYRSGWAGWAGTLPSGGTGQAAWCTCSYTLFQKLDPRPQCVSTINQRLLRGECASLSSEPWGPDIDTLHYRFFSNRRSPWSPRRMHEVQVVQEIHSFRVYWKHSRWADAANLLLRNTWTHPWSFTPTRQCCLDAIL